jgi:hypothetical protein
MERDAKKISKILNKYCLMIQASRYLGHRNFANNLIKTKKLSIARPVLPYSSHPMIEKKQIQAYARENGLILTVA